MASLLLAAPNVHAGTYDWQTKDANGNITAQSPTYTGGTVMGSPDTAYIFVSLSPFSLVYNDTSYTGIAQGGCDATAQGSAVSMNLSATG
jgi:hypothetical protein